MFSVGDMNVALFMKDHMIIEAKTTGNTKARAEDTSTAFSSLVRFAMPIQPKDLKVLFKDLMRKTTTLSRYVLEKSLWQLRNINHEKATHYIHNLTAYIPNREFAKFVINIGGVSVGGREYRVINLLRGKSHG